jgi:ligand-binding sensor domain-containing protein
VKSQLIMRLAVFINCIFALIAFKVQSQPFYFRHYQVENGLSNNTVNCSVQDSLGFMWFGTKDGLNRFDGYRFKKYDLPQKKGSITPDNIYSLRTDTDGILWVGSEKGLFKFDPVKEHLYNCVDSIGGVGSIIIDQNQQLWFSARGIIYIYNISTNKLRRFNMGENWFSTSLCIDMAGDIWASTTNGYIHKLNVKNGQFESFNIFSHSLPAASNWIQTIAPADSNALFVGTSNQGLKKFDIKSKTYTDVLTYNTDNTIIFVRDILKNTDNEFWLATEYGIYIIYNNSKKTVSLKKKFQDPYSLSDNPIYTLAKDSEGGIWAGTFFGGINYYQPQYTSFHKYFPDNSSKSISGNVVREICEDKYGNLWIGTEDAGLNKLNKATGNIVHYMPTGAPTSISYSNIHGLMADDDKLWIGTFEYGIDIMDVRTGKVIKNYKAGPGEHELKSNFTLSFLKLRNGKILVATTNGLYQYNAKDDNFDRSVAMPDDAFVASLFEAKDGTIWVGTYGKGAFYYNPNTLKKGSLKNNPSDPTTMPNNTINAICEDTNHNIWLATEGGGLCKIGQDNKTVKQYTTNNGFPSNFIFNIIEENEQSLWVTTSRGLVEFNPNTEKTTIYTSANGLLNDQFNYHSGYRDKDGRFYFGSVKGMISFDPSKFKPNEFKPPVYITGFQVHNKELAIGDSLPLKKSIVYTDKIILPYNQSSFSIDFAGLSFTSPEMTEYEYTMDGLDKEWTYIKPNRKVYFTSLSPGNYTFKLKASSNGKWMNEEKTLAIKILPPMWATWWAYLIYFCLFATIFYYLISSYHKRQEDKKEKEIYEAKIDFFTNVAHEIRTPLTLIKGPVDNLLETIDMTPELKEDVETMDRNTNRLITLISQILDFRQTETKGFSLYFTKVNLNLLLQEVYLDFMSAAKKNHLSYNIELPDSSTVTEADEEALRKIFSNLLSNAVKYAQANIWIKLYSVQKKYNSIIVEVSNDGYIIPEEMQEKIFEPFFRLKENIKQKGTGIGLALAKSLALLHDGDLYLKNTDNSKNTFVLTIPMKNQN